MPIDVVGRLQRIEPQIQEVGRSLLESARKHRASASLADRLTDWALSDQAFKVQLFRFVDVFPSLRDPVSVHQHLTEYLMQPGVSPPAALRAGIKAGGLLKGVMAKTVSSQIQAMAKRFIAGVDADDALPLLEKRWKKGVAFSVDLLGEACLSDAEAEAYRTRYVTLIDRLAELVTPWRPMHILETDHLGPLPRANVSIKISSLAARVDPIDMKPTVERLTESLGPILQAAADKGVFINFDIESHDLKDLAIDLFISCCEKYNFEAGLALQAYLRSGEADARRVIDWARRTGRAVTVRLVKGAYWDYEVIHAQEQGWPVPVWTRKSASDACFERMAALLLDATPTKPGEGGTKLALGSHNARSVAAALAYARSINLPTEALEWQMLYGMADELKGAAHDQNMRVREYMPVGELIPGMAYLVRRLLENTSNQSWLLQGADKNADPAALLAAPTSGDEDTEAYRPGPTAPGIVGVGDGLPFYNESFRDFADPEQRETFAAAVAGAQVPAVANDTTVEAALESVRVAHEAFGTWAGVEARSRSNTMSKAADLMRRRRDELSGIIVRESGKPWRESDADVAEAIDFCEYYARQAVELFEPRRLGEYLGERDEIFYQPRGVAVVISPWNFPLAICTGMAAAALVTGNPAIVKPAEQTPGIAKLMCEIMWEAGVPKDVLHFVPGRGETVGAALVRDPRVAIVAFTGSKPVGLDIAQAIGTTGEDQPHLKRIICEMGGKNAVIVDESADLDEAVAGVRDSAFGYAGQKCSACSRAIVLDAVYDRFVQRLLEASRSLVCCDPLDPSADLGPVIDDEAADKVKRYIAIGKEEGKLALESSIDGRYIGPHIFTDIRPDHRLANEEIFGPVLAVIRVKDFDEALKVANGTTYKLTGGCFSRTPTHLDRVKRQYRVGNLYLNRKITGALVGRQPFGGFGLSGGGTKAGGDAYLLNFVDPRVITENTMRRGFSPELAE